MTAADWQAELNELIAAGWGEAARVKPPANWREAYARKFKGEAQGAVPPDWRERYARGECGPDRPFSREQKRAVSAGLSRGWHKRRPTRSFARLKDVAARMRAKYVTRRRISQKRNAEKRWENLASRKSLKGRSKKA